MMQADICTSKLIRLFLNGISFLDYSARVILSVNTGIQCYLENSNFGYVQEEVRLDFLHQV